MIAGLKLKSWRLNHGPAGVPCAKESPIAHSDLLISTNDVLPARSRRGFTLVEMMIVVAVIIAIMAAAIPLYARAKADAQVRSTRVLLEGVASAMDSYGHRSFTYFVGASAQPRVKRLWDVDTNGAGGKSDGIIDGDPAAGEVLPADIVSWGYTGFLDMAQPPIEGRNVGEKRRVIDAWGNPLRISYPQDGEDSRRFGASGFSVWSVGPDGLEDTDDDLHHGEME